MVMVYTIQVRVRKSEREQIRENAKAKGFGTVSSYLRYLGLERDFVIEDKINEIHSHLIQKPDGKKFKPNGALNKGVNTPS